MLIPLYCMTGMPQFHWSWSLSTYCPSPAFSLSLPLQCQLFHFNTLVWSLHLPLEVHPDHNHPKSSCLLTHPIHIQYPKLFGLIYANLSLGHCLSRMWSTMLTALAFYVCHSSVPSCVIQASLMKSTQSIRKTLGSPAKIAMLKTQIYKIPSTVEPNADPIGRTLMDSLSLTAYTNSQTWTS